MNKRSFMSVIVLIGFGIFHENVYAAEEPSADINNDEKKDDDSQSNQTFIEESVPTKKATEFSYYKDKSSDQTPGDASMLFHIPGLTLTETGGPLSSSEIRYRGLANSRFRIDLEGLTLNNPLTGIHDANSLFLFAAKNLHTNAQSLSINLPKIEHPQARTLFGYGSHDSMKLGASAGTPFDKYSSVFLAMQASSTNGRFSYASPDQSTDDPANNFERENNDHHRLQALVKYQRQTAVNGSHALLAFNGHEGGIAGYSMSPTKHLRSQTLYSGLKVGHFSKIKETIISLDAANSVFDYQTHDRPAHDEHLSASSHEFTLGFKRLGLPKWLDMDFSQILVLERAYQLNKSRIGGGFSMNRHMQGSGRLKPQTFATFSMLGFHQHGLIFKKEFGASIEPMDSMVLTGRFIRHQRLPTFMELYANNSFFIGNEDLEKESVYDFELGTTVRLGAFAHLQLTGFLGYLSDVIVYVPFLADRVQPTNTGSARRHGVDLGLSVEPLPWLLVETKNSFINTKIMSTGAPLPQAPPFFGLTKLRLGNEDFLALTLQSRYRTSATANLYGTLKSPAYNMVDAILSAHVYDYLGLSFSVSNIFNVKTARDTYEIPLPGTMFFGQIEVGNV